MAWGIVAPGRSLYRADFGKDARITMSEFDDTLDQEVMYRFEQAQLALDQATLALRNARVEADTFLPQYLRERLYSSLNDIEGLARGIMSSRPEDPPMAQPYRSGLLCSIDGVGYWHTGCQYWIAIGGSADGPQEDLRELMGFDKVAARFDQYSSLLFGPDWKEVGDADASIAAAIGLLKTRMEQMWWASVTCFLREYNGRRVDRELARRTLLDNGFDADKVARLLPE